MRSRAFASPLAAIAAACIHALMVGTAAADGNQPPNATLASRHVKPDGSVAMTIGRRLPTEWDVKVGTDVQLAAPASPIPADNILQGAGSGQSSGALWGNLTLPGLVWDKTALEARIDAGKEEGKFGATLSRSVPLGSTAVTLKNAYSVRQPLAGADAAMPAPENSLVAVDPAPMPPTGPMSSVLTSEQSIQLSIKPSGTTISAGAASSTVDDRWHNKLSLEQTLAGPLKVTTSVEDAGTVESKASIVAGFKRTW